MALIDNNEIMKYWDYKKNTLDPNIMLEGSEKKAWWVCEYNHSYQASIRLKTRNSEYVCSVCNGRIFVDGVNSFNITHPDLAIKIDENRSGIQVNKITKSYTKKIWWICDKGHPHIDTIIRKINGSGCAVCNGRQILKGYNDLQTKNPKIAAELNTEKSGITADKIGYGNSKDYFYWNCNNGHIYKMKLSKKYERVECPYCSCIWLLKGYNDLETKYPEYKNEYDTIKNDLGYNEVCQRNLKLWWICSEGHSYQEKIYNKVCKNHHCPYCSNHRFLAGFNDLQTKFPKIASELNAEKSGFKADEILYGTTKLAWWTCVKCNYEWKTKVNNRTGTNRGSGCHACAGKVLIIGRNDLLSQHPRVAAILNENKSGFKANEVFYGSRKYAYFNCSNCNGEIYSQIRKRIVLYNPHLCSNCAGKKSLKEEKLLETILLNNDSKIITNSRQIIKPLELDIYLPNLNLAIEFNGDYWHSEEVIQKNKGMSADDYHQMKTDMCAAKGITLIHVWEKDWDNDPGKVMKNIQSVIENSRNAIFDAWSYI